jgi:hypothetical protein
MTKEEREVARAAIAAATPLPWKNHESEEENPKWWGAFPKNAPACLIEAEAGNDPVCCTNDDGVATETELANAQYIVTACNTLPAALDALEAAESELQSLREEVCAEAQTVGYYGEEVDSALTCFRSAIQQSEPRMLAAEEQTAKLRVELATLKAHSREQAETIAELNGKSEALEIETGRLMATLEEIANSSKYSGEAELARQSLADRGATERDKHFADCIAELMFKLALASYPGHYISTYCQDGRHENCRLNRKITGEPCLCSCGHPDAGEKPPMYDELRAEVGRLKKIVEFHALERCIYLGSNYEQSCAANGLKSEQFCVGCRARAALSPDKPEAAS